MKQIERYRNQSKEIRIPYPEITCPYCSGRMEFESSHPADLVPFSTTLKCSVCGETETIFYEMPVNKEVKNYV